MPPKKLFFVVNCVLLLTQQAMAADSLTVNTVYDGKTWDLWPQSSRLGISYCISKEFGSDHSTVVKALQEAIVDWKKSAYFSYEYKPIQDANCQPGNSKVTFDVRPIRGQDYLMKAFFPSFARAKRTLLVDDSALRWDYASLVGFFRHELGHTLGFRHEHIRVSNGCSESGTWVPLTVYDSSSVMHYPDCPGGTNDINNLILTDADRAGSALAYPYFVPRPRPFCADNPCSSDGRPL